MDNLHFEIVYVCAEGCFRRTLSIGPGTTLSDAVKHARHVCNDFPDEAWTHEAFAIYGKRVEDPSRLISNGDRIEILRPLRMDPSLAGRKRSRL